MSNHSERVENEIATYRNTVNIHALPEIFHYWSCRYLAPDLQQVFGSTDLQRIFAMELYKSLAKTGGDTIVSVGAGDGSVEIAIAKLLRLAGIEKFHFECLELSPHLIERGEEAVRREGLQDHIAFSKVDLTTWQPTTTYGAAFAHHSLHHIVALEHVFDQVHASLRDSGSFVVSDLIGRNGHMRWPEVEALVQRLWRSMPAHYRYDHQLKQLNETFVNWDCSSEGFEGIRAQDIMSELLKRFHFRKYIAWGGLTDIFIDRSFGHNLDEKNAEDCAFIDNLAKADRTLLRAKAITPTSVIGVMTKEQGDLISNGLIPSDAVHASELVPAAEAHDVVTTGSHV